MFVSVEDTRSKLPALPTAEGTLTRLMEAVGRGESVEGGRTSVRGRGHEEAEW